jgi:cytochrome b involved in lipid metabolism
MSRIEYGEETMPEAVVTGLGEHNHGAIAANLEGDRREQFIEDVQDPRYEKLPTDEVVCFDGREDEAGSTNPEGYAPWQIAGSRPVTDTSVDMMVTPNQTQPQSVLIAKNTREAIEAGNKVKAHGDDHKGKAGCGANANDRQVLRSNGENLDIVAPTVWLLSQRLGLDAHITQDDIVHLITTGAENAENDELFDVTPEEKIDIIIANGGEYQVLKGKHRERIAVIKTTEKVFDKDDFMQDHPADDGELDSAFGVALGVYKKKIFEEVRARGGDDREAALRVAAAVAFNVGVAKELTAEEEGHGESLPVVVL